MSSNSMTHAPAVYESSNSYPYECAQHICDEIVKQNKEYDVIVDMGCGTGYLADLLSQSVKHKRIVGLDISPHMITFAEQNHKPMDSVQYLVQDLSQSWDSLSPELKALESKVSLIVCNFAIQWIDDRSRLMHVVSKLLAKGAEFVANYTIKPDLMTLLTDEQISQYNIQLKTQSKDQQLDEIRNACEDNGLQIIELDVVIQNGHIDTNNMKAVSDDWNGVEMFGRVNTVADKTSAAFGCVKNVLFDILLRPDARALNPHAIHEFKANDTNGPIVPYFVPSIRISCLKK